MENSNDVYSNRRLLWAAPLSGFAAALLNAVIYYIGDAIGAFPEELVLPNGEAFSILPVIMSSIVSAIIAGIIFALLIRFSKRPARIYKIMAIVVLVLYIFPPMIIEGASASMIIFLNLMHIVAAICIVGIQIRFTKKD